MYKTLQGLYPGVDPDALDEMVKQQGLQHAAAQAKARAMSQKQQGQNGENQGQNSTLPPSSQPNNFSNPNMQNPASQSQTSQAPAQPQLPNALHYPQQQQQKQQQLQDMMRQRAQLNMGQAMQSSQQPQGQQ